MLLSIGFKALLRVMLLGVLMTQGSVFSEAVSSGLAQQVVRTPVATSASPSSRLTNTQVERSVQSAAAELASTAMNLAQEQERLDLEALSAAALEAPKVPVRLSTEGTPGEVRLVVMTTLLAQRLLPLVPRVPVYPLPTWRRWLKEHPVMSHCALDWMDDEGKWWHTELRGFDHHPEQYRVGEGQLPATGVTVYGIWILPGRSNLENNDLVLEEKIDCDYRIIVQAALEYGRKDKRPGEPGTGGNGKYNVGLGGPAFKPTQNSNTYINYILRQAGVRRSAPPMAIGWETEPHFPYSSDADLHKK